MARGKKGSNRWAKAAHIKKGSYGTTNEISVSVLDAAKQAVESEQGEAPRKLLGVIPLFTLDRNGSSSTMSMPSKTLVERGDNAAPMAPEPILRGEEPVIQEEKAAKKADKQRRKEERAERKRQKALAKAQEQQVKAAPQHEKPKEHKPLFKKAEAGERQPFEEKAEKKKAARLRRRIIAGIVAAAVAVAGVAFVGMKVYEEQLLQASKVSIVDKSLSQIEQADVVITKMNDVLSDPKAADAKEKLAELGEELPQATLSLQRAKSLVEQGIEGMQDGYDKEAATRAQKAIEARLTMLTEGKTLAADILSALTDGEKLDEAWAIIIRADGTARDSAAHLLKPTSENLDAATTGTQNALKLLDEAAAAFNAAPGVEGVDLSPYFSYIEKRKDALNCATGAISALKNEDLDTARSLQDSYAQEDAAAVSIASTLPVSPSALVYEAYQEKAKQSIEAYEKARSAAGSADAMLREYYVGQHK